MAEIKIWEAEHGTSCYYNVGRFLDLINSRDKSLHDRINSFAAALDKKVTIDRYDSKFKPIYDGLDEIVAKIAHGLKTKIPHIYSGLEVISTGSQTSSVKVGLPHEADFLFRLPPKIDCKTYERKETKRLGSILCDDISSVLCDKIKSKDERLKIH